MLPFSLFKAICRLDNSISVDVDEFRDRASAILAYPYEDVRYADWRESLARRNNRWTAMEWLALDAQMYEEQERVRSEQLRVYLDQEFALGNKEPEIETPKVVKIVVTWNVIAILGWVNVALGLIALMPALFGDAKFYHVGGAFGLGWRRSGISLWPVKSG